MQSDSQSINQSISVFFNPVIECNSLMSVVYLFFGVARRLGHDRELGDLVGESYAPCHVCEQERRRRRVVVVTRRKSRRSERCRRRRRMMMMMMMTRRRKRGVTMISLKRSNNHRTCMSFMSYP